MGGLNSPVDMGYFAAWSYSGVLFGIGMSKGENEKDIINKIEIG